MANDYGPKAMAQRALARILDCIDENVKWHDAREQLELLGKLAEEVRTRQEAARAAAPPPPAK